MGTSCIFGQVSELGRLAWLAAGPWAAPVTTTR
eukprot:SAG22_NODE_16332_length_327_cov_1.333333_1_plen_32_part_10